jgi:hypothetical protein
MASSSSMIALDPRDRVGLELDATFEIVFLDRVDEAEDAVGHQIGLLDVRWPANRDPAGHVPDQRRVVEDEPLAGVSGRLELEFLPQPFHGRRLVQEAPLWADVTELVLPAFVARLPYRGVGAPGRPSAQARGCACSYTRRSRSFET